MAPGLYRGFFVPSNRNAGICKQALEKNETNVIRLARLLRSFLHNTTINDTPCSGTACSRTESVVIHMPDV